jgi:hypothetical protein
MNQDGGGIITGKGDEEFVESWACTLSRVKEKKGGTGREDTRDIPSRSIRKPDIGPDHLLPNTVLKKESNTNKHDKKKCPELCRQK